MVCCSATWPAGVRLWAQSYIKNPIEVFIGTLDLPAVHNVSQKIEVVEEEEDKLALVCVSSVQDFGRSMCHK
jgi:ATP-dependent RNA helicase DDX43